jgi:hypothetical protein
MIKSKPQTAFLSISHLCLKTSVDESRENCNNTNCNNTNDIFGAKWVNNSLCALRRIITLYLSQESVFIFSLALKGRGVGKEVGKLTLSPVALSYRMQILLLIVKAILC